MRSSTLRRTPSLIQRRIDGDYVGVRFKQIGSRQRFNGILQRFRTDFLLATCQEIDGQSWWLIASSQVDELKDFCRRNGLCLEDAA